MADDDDHFSFARLSTEMWKDAISKSDLFYQFSRYPRKRNHQMEVPWQDRS